MRRALALAAVAAAFLPAAPASADHLCVYSQGRPVYCVGHFALQIDQICVTQAGQPIVCVP